MHRLRPLCPGLPLQSYNTGVNGMVKEFNILLAGVGGQGVILMSELLGKAAIADGLKVRGSEILGMAVRGGSVTSIIRMGDDVYGPLIPQGKCHILIGLEPSEGLRYVSYLSKSGLVILNTAPIVPFTVSLGQSAYPDLDRILERLNTIVSEVVTLDAAQIAQDAGSLLAANVVMLGALFGIELLPIKTATIKETIRARFPAKVAPVNIRAFDLGYQASRQAVE
ncbi:MAG: indolepyruvate ferredoxin oxidoreductase subunit beta [Dehalococcoidia bacterium]|nr:MAG: indolepyruvate ferredoxin oxidoreductase subunit beta [Dehalococcoidia bacterium]